MRLAVSSLKFVVPCVVFAAGLLRCVGESTPVAAGPDASTDGSTADVGTPDASDAATGDADAAASKCVFPDGGASGTLDPSFQAQFFPSAHNAAAAAIDSTGAIYVAGFDLSKTLCNGSLVDAYVMKMSNSGALDTTFGTNGHLCVQPASANYFFYTAAADPDGTVVGAGLTTDSANSIATTQAFVARVTPAGQLAPAFGTSGTLTYTPFTTNGTATDRSVIFALALDTSVSPAKIVVAGTNAYYFSGPRTKGWVMRFGHDGAPDLSFNGGNPVIDTGVNGFYGVTVVGGSIYVTGASGTPTAQTAIVRKLTSAGVWDPTFGNGNAVPVALSANNVGEGEGVAAAGAGVAVAGPTNANAYDQIGAGAEVVAGMTTAGAVNSSFGTSGTTSITYGSQPGIFQTLYQFGAIANDCEGRLLVSTTVVADAGANFDEVAVARLLPSGALDTTFGQGGFGVATGFNSSASAAPAEDPKTGGVVVVLRRRGNGLDGQVGLVRLNR